MSFDVLRYLRDYRIPYSTQSKHVSVGWVGVRCPLCGDLSDHGGFNLTTGHYSCWRCGGHKLEKVLMALGNIPYHEAVRIVKQYQITGPVSLSRPAPSPGPTHLSLPEGTAKMTERHRNYLRRRHLDPDMLEKKYGLLGTGPAGPYCHRIIIPVYQGGRLVHYQGRDITNQAPIKYKACPKDKAIFPLKDLLYNVENCSGDAVLVVEGAFDVFRLGDDSLALFGVGFSNRQVNLLIHRFKRVVVLFDTDAEKQAAKLTQLLSGAGIETKWVVLPSGDPGDLSQEEADQLKGELLS